MRWFLIITLLLLGCAKKERPAKELYLNIEVKDFGRIRIKLFTEEAPKNVANVAKLARHGFYNGLTFHRIVPGFVIQGGCPKGDGTGDPGFTVKDEISPRLRHKRGTVAMANRGPNTNGSQFYICLADLPRLDGHYTIIGEVIDGMDVVDRIAQVETGPRDRPLKKVVMERVWIEP
ncbi:peptidylprolyl isomerase [candidate division WOR-3 bacterium]|uniref:Peptidyl-prolyl cis-trans isomerase n=1 Tax=candidate division WOR-3 bacterium TaxID=2052148 RepID=A0A660SEY4_UNCW3|nr:MAG: peptidylprolyl isomerase [candidate division WOR-3 bacterium]